MSNVNSQFQGYERQKTVYGSSGSSVKSYVGHGVLGSYDNLTLKTPCKNGWQKGPCDAGLKSNYQWVPQGTPLPLKNEMIYSQLPEDSMFIFARSKASLQCCPSTYSTDRGCICPSDMNMLNQRGNNKTYENYQF